MGGVLSATPPALSPMLSWSPAATNPRNQRGVYRFERLLIPSVFRECDSSNGWLTSTGTISGVRRVNSAHRVTRAARMNETLSCQSRLGPHARLVRCLALVLAAALVSSASASVITLDAFERGFITQSGATNPTNNPPETRDYLLGNCSLASCFSTGAGEYRNFFGFLIPTITGNIVSVSLQLATVGVDLQQAPSMTALFTSLATTSSFAALGTGTAYGSSNYSAADANLLLSTALDASAIADILANQGASFLIGGRALGVSSFDPNSPNQLIFEHSGHIVPPDLTRLVITTDATDSVPEPGSLALVGIGLAVLIIGRRRAVISRH